MQKRKKHSIDYVVINAVLIISLIVCIVVSFNQTSKKEYHQNIENIENIAIAKAESVQLTLENSNQELATIYNYCNGKSRTEILDYLSLVIPESSEYQLLTYQAVGSGDLYHVYSGYSTKKVDGNFSPVTYHDTSISNSLYSCTNEVGVISFSEGFTNYTDASKYYGAFCGIMINEEGIDTLYYLVKLQKGKTILDQLKMYSQYDSLATAICNSNGKYLAYDSGYKSDNFFSYLTTYNSLTVDERLVIESEVENNTSEFGYLEFKNSKKNDSIFAYALCGNSDSWFVVVSLETSEFVSTSLFSLPIIIIMIFLFITFTYNVFRLLQLVKLLKISAESERIANESKSSFLSRMSHEIRTPLNAVMGYMTIAKYNIESIDKVSDCISKTEISAKHLLAVINDILDISAIESGKIKIVSNSFNFKSFVNSITVMFYSLATAKNVKFDVIFENMVDESVIGDQMRLNQILINLLNNAIKFTPTSGQVTLKIKQEDINDSSMLLRFQVIDTGIGMSEEQITRIWEPFEQADNTISRKYGGSGLGLTITRNLVNIMNGKIDLESKEGIGSTFTVTLKFGKTKQQITNLNYDFSDINALVIDDDVDSCAYTKNLLNQYSIKCEVAYSGQDGISAIAEHQDSKNPFNLLLLDMKMESLNGIETARLIKAKYKADFPIIILSAYDLSEYMDEAKTLGISKFLTKPLFRSALFDLLVSLKSEQSTKDTIEHIETTTDYDFKGSTILLAEDNQTNMEIAIDLLSFVNLNVEKAWNGKEAFDKFTTSEPGTYKAILMDVQMPVMDGYTATKEIRNSSHPEAKTIPIIAMTANAFEQDIHASLDAGMNDHVSKPIDELRLFEILKRFDV